MLFRPFSDSRPLLDVNDLAVRDLGCPYFRPYPRLRPASRDEILDIFKWTTRNFGDQDDEDFLWRSAL